MINFNNKGRVKVFFFYIVLLCLTVELPYNYLHKSCCFIHCKKCFYIFNIRAITYQIQQLYCFVMFMIIFVLLLDNCNVKIYLLSNSHYDITIIMCVIKNLLSKLNTERYKYENCCYMYLFHLNTVI